VGDLQVNNIGGGGGLDGGSGYHNSDQCIHENELSNHTVINTVFAGTGDEGDEEEDGGGVTIDAGCMDFGVDSDVTVTVTDSVNRPQPTYPSTTPNIVDYEPFSSADGHVNILSYDGISDCEAAHVVDVLLDSANVICAEDDTS